MVQLMNIVVADRRIFGGVNNSSRAFNISEGSTGKIVNYHGIPLNNYQDPTLFPYSGVSYADIGIGIGMGNNDRIDPQSAIPITFNGAQILGSGLDGKTTFLNFDSLTAGNYSLDVSVGSNKQTITFTIPDNFNIAITTAIDALPPGSTADVIAAATSNAINNAKAAIVNQALNARFGSQISVGTGSGLVINNIAGGGAVTIENTPPTLNGPGFQQAGITVNPSGFSANVIQLVLDSAQALKADDRYLAAQYADALFALQTNVSLTLAEIGNMQEFIEFNLERTTNNMMSLLEQQKDLEASKPEEQITMIKVLEALFSAQLQMGANLLPMSIFNFIS
jgi:hypothetical protein